MPPPTELWSEAIEAPATEARRRALPLEAPPEGGGGGGAAAVPLVEAPNEGSPKAESPNALSGNGSNLLRFEMELDLCLRVPLDGFVRGGPRRRPALFSLLLRSREVG